jgi:hypothetical protein
MIQALAPGIRRGCSWVWLSIVLAGAGWPVAVVAQAQDTKPAPATTKGQSPSAKGDTPAAKPEAKKAAEPAKKEAEPEPEPEAGPNVGNPGSFEVFKDDRAEKALTVFKSIPGFRDTNPSVITQVKSMAAGQANTDRETLQRFVQGMVYRLADKNYINGLISPPPGQRMNAFAATAIEDTTENLIDALNSARLAKNTGFLTEYNRVLIETLPKLLDNNLVSRVEAMIVLGQTGDPNVVPIFLEQLKKPDQTIWVKLWAARGLYNVVDGGTRVDSVLNVQRASEAGKALSDFLNTEKDIPWPVRVRALEAMGAMRQAALPVAPQKVEMAATAMKFLADTEARPEVRAAAAWALGMMRVNPLVGKYNFGIVAYDMGKLAAELGEVAGSRFSDNPTLSEYMAGLLVGPVFQAFNGTDGARESGLLKVPAAHPNIGPNVQYIRQIADLESSIAKAAVEMIRSPGGAQAARRKDLGDRVASLKAFLEKSPAKDFHLVPGGPEFKPDVAAANANANAGLKSAAGAPGGQ